MSVLLRERNGKGSGMKSVAAKVASLKRLHPERYCPVRGCLWRTGDGALCPRHKSNEDGLLRRIDRPGNEHFDEPEP